MRGQEDEEEKRSDQGDEFAQHLEVLEEHREDRHGLNDMVVYGQSAHSADEDEAEAEHHANER